MSVRVRSESHLGETWLSLGSYEDLLNSDFDYWEIKKQLKQVGMEMVKVLRIHNRHLKERFEQEKQDFMKVKPAGFDINIQDLYHATKVPLDKICEEGLDERESPLGHFGRGIYLSDNPDMCRVYCEDETTTTSAAATTPATTTTPTTTPPVNDAKYFMMRCKVILGEPKVYSGGQFDVGLTREPVKSNVAGKLVYYDSVEGQVGPYTQYIVYEKRRVHIQYVVYYTTTRALPVLPAMPVKTTRPSQHKHTPGPKTAWSKTYDSRTDKLGANRPPSDDERSPRDDERPPSDDERPPSDDERSPRDDERPPSDDERSVVCRCDSDSDSDNVCQQTGPQQVDRNRPVTSTNGGSTTSTNRGSTTSANRGSADSLVQKVSVTRDRTRRLVNTGSTDAVRTSSQQSVGQTTTTTTTTTTQSLTPLAAGGPSAANNNPGLESTATALYRQTIQQTAIQKMLELKGRIPDKQLDDLLTSYTVTYGQLLGPTASVPGQLPVDSTTATAASAVDAGCHDDDDDDVASDSDTGLPSNNSLHDGRDDIEEIMSSLLEEFGQLVPGVDQLLARQYIEQYNMDLQVAVGAYFDDNM